jgi:hypothetical protein
MSYVINKFFSFSLYAEKRRINMLFLIFFIAYSIRTVTSIVLHFKPDGWVCQYQLRLIISGIMHTFFTYSAIVAILYFQRNSISGKRDSKTCSPQEQQTNARQSVDVSRSFWKSKHQNTTVSFVQPGDLSYRMTYNSLGDHRDSSADHLKISKRH